MTEWVDAARVAAAVGALAFASWTDLRSREVPDGLWYALAAAALALMALDFGARFGGDSWVLVIAVAAVFAVAVTGGEIITVIPGDKVPEGPIDFTEAQKRVWLLDMLISASMLAGAVGVFVVAPSLDLGTPGRPLSGPEAQAYAACLMMGAALVFYMMNALHGGADAKGLMVLALLFPVAPAIAGLPLIPAGTLAVELLPFALVVFFNGALIQVVAAPVWFGAVGLRNRQFRWPLSLTGYAKPVEAINLERDFLMGSLRGGEWKPHIILSRSAHSEARQKEGLEVIRESGAKTAFVSPKAPFMVFLLLGLVMAVVATSPLHWIGVPP
ncbi:MAG TPA: hypothetical protein VGB42_13205 [Candidatus Thermoplasmatota archaeon]